MIVADRTSTSQPQKCLDRRARAIHGIAKLKLFGDSTTLGSRNIASIETRRNQLRRGRIRKQVTGELLDGELIEWHVLVVSVDHPIAIRPYQPVVVQMQSMRVTITSYIQPMLGHLLPVMRGSKQLIDISFVSFLRR